MGQILAKVDEDDYDTQWINAPSGGGVSAGTILWFPATTPPPGILACNGDVLDQSEYADLYAIVGTTFNGVTLVPQLMTNITPGWKVSASTEAEPAYKAFDQIGGSSRWRANGSTGWIKNRISNRGPVLRLHPIR